MPYDNGTDPSLDPQADDFERDAADADTLATTERNLAPPINQLVQRVLDSDSPNATLYEDMLQTVLRMAKADRNRWDSKIMARTLREMEHAFATLHRFRHRRKVTVFGSARTAVSHDLYVLARKLGAALAARDRMVITGAGGGIMAAAHEGAGRENSLGLNITLPFEQHANATMEGSDQLLPFHFFYVRKLFFLKEAEALVLCPGGFGTLDETLEVLTLVQTGKSPLVPIILLDAPGGTYWKDFIEFTQKHLVDAHYVLPSDLNLVELVDNEVDAVEAICRFYTNFHSTRWLDGRLISRMHHALSSRALGQLDERFADLCLQPGFSQDAYTAEEAEQAEYANMTRLSFRFNGRDHGRLRELVDFINRAENWAS